MKDMPPTDCVPYQTTPDGYSYEVTSFKRNVWAIWIVNHRQFSYTDTPPRSIWGFYHSKKNQYYAPINSKKVGKEVNLEDTTPYSAMAINYKGLESFFV